MTSWTPFCVQLSSARSSISLVYDNPTAPFCFKNKVCLSAVPIDVLSKNSWTQNGVQIPRDGLACAMMSQLSLYTALVVAKGRRANRLIMSSAELEMNSSTISAIERILELVDAAKYR